MPEIYDRIVKRSTPVLANLANELRSALKLFPAETLASATGSKYTNLGTGSGEFHLPFFESVVMGTYPDLKFYSALGDELPDFNQLLLLYYFASADGSELTGKYVSYADLPGGRIYAEAFQGYTGNEIVKVFGSNIESFRTACQAVNGKALNIADAAFSFQVLPKLQVQVVYWLGDEDFPSSCRILFDTSATHYAPIDVCAIIGSNLAQRIIKKQLSNQVSA